MFWGVGDVARADAIAAYPQCYEGEDPSKDVFSDTVPTKLTRPLSAPGSPKDRSGVMTPGDFASLQEGLEGLSTEDYIAWKLPEEEDPEDYTFPLTLRSKRPSHVTNASIEQSDGAVSPTERLSSRVNGPVPVLKQV